MIKRYMPRKNDKTPSPILMQRPDKITDTMHELSKVHHLFSTTIQKALMNLSILEAWIDRCMSYGERPIILIDEAHLCSNSRKSKFGSIARLVQDKGAHVVLLTGTPYRADNADIPGFDIRTISEKDVSVVLSKRIDDEKIIKEYYEGVKTERILQPHHSVSLSKAWEIGALCKVESHWVDVDLTIDGERVCFKDMKRTEAQKYLRKVVTHPEVISKAVEKSINDMKERHVAGMPDAGILIVTASDIETEESDGLANWHARQVRDAFLSFDSSLDIDIATMAGDNEEDNKTNQANKKIKRFTEGRGDVLIVKNMGTVGLDCPRIKTVVFLGTARQLATWIQTILRGATLADKITHYTLILTNDIMNRENYEFIVTSQGGGFESSTLEKVKEEIVDKPLPPDDEKKVEVLNAGVTHIKDSHNNNIVTDDSDVRRAIKKSPILKERMSTVEIKQMIDAGTIILTDDDVEEESDVIFTNTGEDCSKLKKEIHALTKQLASKLSPYAANENAWRNSFKQVDREGKDYAGIRRRIPEENDAEKLRLMRDYLQSKLEIAA